MFSRIEYMEILSLILEIRFGSKTPLIVDDKRQKLVELIIGKPPKDKPPDTPKIGMALNDVASKTRVIVEESRVAISVEQSDIEKSKKRLLEVLKTIYKQVDYKTSPVWRVGVRTQWICLWKDSFTSLLSCFREKFYANNSLLQEAVDVGIALTLEDGQFKVNYSTGPMKPEQGKQLLIFKDRQLPHDFIFIDIDRYSIDDKKTYEIESIKQFIVDSITYGKSKAEETERLLHG